MRKSNTSSILDGVYCRDTSEYCSAVATTLCESEIDIREKCPMTCKICKCEDGQNCDKVNGQSCMLSEKLRKRCPLSCGLCKGMVLFHNELPYEKK